MAHAFPASDISEIGLEPENGEWQALRGELVALLDQVESRYAPPQAEPEPDLDRLTRRVRSLRNQVHDTPTTVRHRAALSSVKRALDRFSERDETVGESNELAAAIAEIRERKAASGPTPSRRNTDKSQLVELTGLVSSLSERLERLETDLNSQRTNASGVREVAGQVEQLTQVVELLAGAVGETGQVKRLEAQLAHLATMVENAPRVDLDAVNARLDEVASTVGKLAELQVQQMEREIAREEAPAVSDPQVTTSMRAIEDGVRNIYDRLDALERVAGLPTQDLERLSGEMAAITAAVESRGTAPDALIGKIDELAQRIGGFEDHTGDVAALRNDMAGLRDALLKGFEPRFERLETRIEALTEKVGQPPAEVPGVARIEAQLQALMTRLDDTGKQIDCLARLYGDQKGSGIGTSEMTALADLVAERTSEAIGNSGASAADQGTLDAIEQRMSALINTAGKDTAERLERLEAVLSVRTSAPAKPAASREKRSQESRHEPRHEPRKDLDSILAALSAPPRDKDAGKPRDVMPANPADEAPLVDESFKPKPVRAGHISGAALRQPGDAVSEGDGDRSTRKALGLADFDPASVERPAKPVSSLAEPDPDPFAPAPAPAAAPTAAVEREGRATSSQSTFIAAARRAQRARQGATETEIAGANSLIARALSRVMGSGTDTPEAALKQEPEAPVPQGEKIAQPKAHEAAPNSVRNDSESADEPATQSFISRNRRPLLLAAALVAVSVLALNLYLTRTQSPSADTVAAATAQPAEAAEIQASPTIEEDQASLDPVLDATPIEVNASLTPPRIMAASIDPDVALSFARASESVSTPQALAAAEEMADTAPAPAAPEATDETLLTSAIPDIADSPIDFAPPPEGVGPEALRQAAADGDARAQFEVAAILAEGRAVEQDLTGASIWYERAAAQGFAPAQYRLGNFYESGNGVEKNLELARLWYQRAAEAGNRMAMHNLAAIHASGALGEQDFETAAEWFERAAERGMTDSQFNLGMLYARGLGVEQSFENSYKWFSIAARSGDADAAKARDDMARSLTAEAIKRVDTELGSWKATEIDLAANFAPIGTWSGAFDPGSAISNTEVVTRVQQALGKLGYDIGTPDGLVGPKTREAIRDFERGTGMSESGLVNPRLLAVLGSQPV